MNTGVITNDFLRHQLQKIEKENAELRRQLEIATEALEYYADKENWSREDGWIWMPNTPGKTTAEKALAKIDKYG